MAEDYGITVEEMRAKLLSQHFKAAGGDASEPNEGPGGDGDDSTPPAAGARRFRMNGRNGRTNGRAAT